MCLEGLGCIWNQATRAGVASSTHLILTSAESLAFAILHAGAATSSSSLSAASAPLTRCRRVARQRRTKLAARPQPGPRHSIRGRRSSSRCQRREKAGTRRPRSRSPPLQASAHMHRRCSSTANGSRTASCGLVARGWCALASRRCMRQHWWWRRWALRWGGRASAWGGCPHNGENSLGTEHS